MQPLHARVVGSVQCCRAAAHANLQGEREGEGEGEGENEAGGEAKGESSGQGSGQAAACICCNARIFWASDTSKVVHLSSCT